MIRGPSFNVREERKKESDLDNCFNDGEHDEGSVATEGIRIGNT